MVIGSGKTRAIVVDSNIDYWFQGILPEYAHAKILSATQDLAKLLESRYTTRDGLTV